MKNITVKNLVDFKKLSMITKQSFANNFLFPQEKKGDGGHYWISCLSAMGNACKANDVDILKEKIEYLKDEKETASREGTKIRHQKNINILSPYTTYDISKWRPKQVEFLSQSNGEGLLMIRGLAIEVSPSLVYSYLHSDVKEVGAIWFVAQKGGFKPEELGIFSELAYRYLQAVYGKSYHINPNNCIVIDIVSRAELRYPRVPNREIIALLNRIIDDMKKSLRIK
jgi:hypothetical protein